jgi:predicted porin
MQRARFKITRVSKATPSSNKTALTARRYLPIGAAVLPLAMCAFSAHAVEIAGSGGDWTVDVGGIVNAYYTPVSCSGQAVGGIALAGKGLGCDGENHKTTLGNGLLPSGLITKFKTTQEGIEIGGTIGIMVAAAASSGVNPNTQIDVRQAFFTLGTAEAGTLKIGRDYGIFGANAILNDMTLLGAGAPVQATQRGRVTLGHIGAGYTYLDNYGQFSWVSPVLGSGFTISAGVFSPVDNGESSNAVQPDGTILHGINDYVSKAYPQFQAQLQYAGNGFKAWLGGKTQKFYGAAGTSAAGQDFTDNSGEIGASYTAGPFGILANFQSGKGIGILSDGDQGPVTGRNYLIQGTYKLTDKLKFGLNYGQSHNNNNSFNQLVNAGFKDNDNVTGGLYYALTKSVTLVGELSETESKDYYGATAKMYGGSLGGIIFF